MLGVGAGQTLRIIRQFPSTAETKTCRAYATPSGGQVCRHNSKDHTHLSELRSKKDDRKHAVEKRDTEKVNRMAWSWSWAPLEVYRKVQ